MANRKSGGTEPKDALPGEAELARVYRAAKDQAPPADLDARILHEARRAAAKPKTRAPFGARWVIPLSTAAVMVLTLGVLLFVSEERPLTVRDAPPPGEPPAISQAKSEAKAIAPESPKKTDALEKLPAPAAAWKSSDNAAVGTATSAARERDQMPLAERAQPEARAKAKAAKEADVRIAADITAVQVSGAPGAYQFNVTIRSPDTGCNQYADWWEVVSADGKLLYRRVLAHSHVDEQPFARSGGPVAIRPDTLVWVRAHMNTEGYGGAAFKGSVRAGFAKAEPPPEFAAGLAKQPPLPDGCAF